MEPWSVTHYRRPFLDVDRITSARSGVVIQQGETSYELGVSDERHGATRLAAMLDDLRRPGSTRWAEVLNGNGRWAPLLTTLDHLGLLSDDDSALVDADDAAAQAEHAAAEGARWLTGNVASSRRAALASRARELTTIAEMLLRGRPLRQDALRSRNFLRDLLVRQMRAWGQTAPLTLTAVDVMLRPLAGVRRRGRVNRLLGRDGTGMYDAETMRTQLDTFCVLLALSTTRAGRRLISPKVSVDHKSGLNLMLDAERLAARCLRQLGEPAFQRQLAAGEVPPRVGRGVYIEQFHLSRRFVEILTAVMRRQVRGALRDRLFRYFAEEVGHEVFEREAARSVAVTDEELDRSVQLPLFAAYLDVLTDMSEHNPIGLLLSLLVAEGFPGTSTPVNDGLERAGLAARGEAVRRHEELNVELYHSTAPRVILSSIPVVEPHVQREALADLVMMVELNFRAWNMFVTYYANAKLPFPYAGVIRAALPLGAVA